jgi:hypothetical protein
MPRYPVRPWFHPKQIMASQPFIYPVWVVAIFTFLSWPYRYKIARYYERQSDTACQALKGKTVRLYREVERMHRRELTFARNPIYDEMCGTRMALPIQAQSFQKGQTDAEYQYWESHQRDVLRARKLQREIEDLKARIGSEAKA